MRRILTPAFVCVAMVFVSGIAAAQQKTPERMQRPVEPMPPASTLVYRTFTAAQLGRADQRDPVMQTGRGVSGAVPNTANVIEEIFKRGLGPIVLGVPGQLNADGTPKPSFVLNNQKEVFHAVNPTARRSAAEADGNQAAGRQAAGQPSAARHRLKRNLVALKVNMIICGNGITVNDPGWRFADLSLAPGFDVAKFPIYPNCETCNGACPGVCFMTSELNCRCYLEHLPTDHRAAGPSPIVVGGVTMPRRLRDLAAFADTILTNWEGASEADLDTVNQTIETVNGAFSSELPFTAGDIVQWGGADGRLVLSSVRSLSEVPLLVAE